MEYASGHIHYACRHRRGPMPLHVYSILVRSSSGCRLQVGLLLVEERDGPPTRTVAVRTKHIPKLDGCRLYECTPHLFWQTGAWIAQI
ncbi:hypothetical protein EE612_034240 [Oryza sativa]|nr:hypothetical protein EE612_034240 [Oryza sativa]